MNVKKVSTKLVDLVKGDSLVDIYKNLIKLRKDQKEYFSHITAYDFIELIFYTYSLKVTEDFSYGENLLQKSIFVCLCNGEGNHPERTCDECGRSYPEGVVECPDCDGSGNFRCDLCNGRGDVKCDECDGDGRIDCDECNGSGKIGEETCDNCDGDGRISCYDCSGDGRNSCSDCGGDGEIRCDTCDGSGGVECKECDGSGEVTDEDSYDYNAEFFIFFNEEANEILKNANELKRKIPSELYNKDIFNDSLLLGSYIFEFKEEIFTDDYFCPVVFDSVKDIFENLGSSLRIESSVFFNFLDAEIEDYMDLL